MPATASQCWLLLLCLSIRGIDGIDAVRPMNSPAPTHSNFLRTALQGGRQRQLWCSSDPTVCSDPEKNPWGGNTCCFRRFCKDTLNDSNHCGGCGLRCPFGLACCGGQCVDVGNDRRHCGSCYNKCPGRLGCSFAMCDYGGGGDL